MLNVCRVVVVGSVLLYREGLAEALRRRTALSVVGTRSSLEDVLACLAELAPDVIVVLDMMQVDPRITPLVRANTSHVPIIQLDYADSETSIDELVRVIECAARGVLSRPHVPPTSVHCVSSAVASGPAHRLQPNLTRREREIGNLIARGLSNREIAAVLEIEIATVKNHVHSVLEKLGVHRRTQAARLILGGPWLLSRDSGHFLEAR